MNITKQDGPHKLDVVKPKSAEVLAEVLTGLKHQRKMKKLRFTEAIPNHPNLITKQGVLLS